MNQSFSEHDTPAFSVIICTYMRPESIVHLLNSLQTQTCVPKEILVVDGSTDDQTGKAIAPFIKSLPVRYIAVDASNRGLTKQRNVGIKHLDPTSAIVFFLDDDIIAEPDFFEQMLRTFNDRSVIGCDGLITNECYWQPVHPEVKLPSVYQQLDQYFLPLSARDRFRARIGLFPLQLQPGKIPRYGHGKSSLPPTGKQYEVDHIMGGITAYRKQVFNHIQFSPFFEGYGLYEDYDFSVRANAYGRLVTNTAARISHHHAESGRPNTYIFGKMVVRNGWYVWRLKHPHPGWVNMLKWHLITLLLAFFRLSNVLTGSLRQRRQAWGDFSGRMVAWFHLFFAKPNGHS